MKNSMTKILILFVLSTLSITTYANIPTALHGNWIGVMDYVYLDNTTSQYSSGVENYDLTVTTNKFNLLVNSGTANEWTEEELFDTSNNNPPMNSYLVKKEYARGTVTDSADMTGYCSVDFCNISFRSIHTSSGTPTVWTYDLTYQLMGPNTLKVIGKRAIGNVLFLRWESILTKQP